MNTGISDSNALHMYGLFALLPALNGSHCIFSDKVKRYVKENDMSRAAHQSYRALCLGNCAVVIGMMIFFAVIFGKS